MNDKLLQQVALFDSLLNYDFDKGIEKLEKEIQKEKDFVNLMNTLYDKIIKNEAYKEWIDEEIEFYECMIYVTIYRANSYIKPEKYEEWTNWLKDCIEGDYEILHTLTPIEEFAIFYKIQRIVFKKIKDYNEEDIQEIDKKYEEMIKLF